ncbi:ribonuclease H-like domain-containing protein [Tanacetum coccineum]
MKHEVGGDDRILYSEFISESRGGWLDSLYICNNFYMVSEPGSDLVIYESKVIRSCSSAALLLFLSFILLCLSFFFIMVNTNSSEDKISNLDLGNPLHLQTSDFNSNTIISVKLTGTENYRVWADAMNLAINTRNKAGFLDGTLS